MTIRVGTVATTLAHSMALADYPESIAQDGFPHVLSELDVQAMTRAAKVASKDEYRPVLTALCLRGGHVEATDSYRAFRSPLTFTPELDGLGIPSDEYLLPAPVVKYVKAGDELLFSEGSASWDEGTIRRIEGVFPNLESFLNSEAHPHSATFSPKRLIEQINVLGTPPKASGTPYPVQIGPEGAGYTMPGKAAVHGPMDLCLAEKAGFNAAYLCDVLSLLGDEAEVRYTDTLKPWLFISGEDRAILMPVRIP